MTETHDQEFFRVIRTIESSRDGMVKLVSLIRTYDAPEFPPARIYEVFIADSNKEVRECWVVAQRVLKLPAQGGVLSCSPDALTPLRMYDKKYADESPTELYVRHLLCLKK